MFAEIADDVKKLMSGDDTGHGFEHVGRVYDMTLDLCAAEKADAEIAGLAALLHDVDDYKLFGQAAADKLVNARRIMQKNHIAADVQEKVCAIIAQMGYSKALQGIRPQTLEGQIVSDADMLDAIGACGIVRCLTYALARCETVVFDRKVFPEPDLTAAEYKMPNRKSDNFINHFFEKMLKLKDMMFTSSGRREAALRHKVMVDFLRAFFREQKLDDWLDYLENYEKKYHKAEGF